MSLCKHEITGVPINMATPQAGTMGPVKCLDCGYLVGNCRWEQDDEGEWCFVVDPPKIAETFRRGV